MKSKFALLGLVSMFGSLVPIFSAYAVLHPIGTNVKTTDGTIYFLSEDGTRRPYNSAGAFLSFGFNTWSDVQYATAEDLNLPVGKNISPQDGKIICDTKQRVGTCYLISGGQKYAFTSAQAFGNAGFKFENALYGDVSFLPEAQNISTGTEAHKPGVLINKNGTIYLVTQNGLLGIPDLVTFWAWGYELSRDVVFANGEDNVYAQVGVLEMRKPGKLSPIPDSFTNAFTPQNPQTNSGAYGTASLSSVSPSSQIGSQQELFAFYITAPQNAGLTISQISWDFSGTLPYSYLSNLKIYNSTTGGQVGSNAGNVFAGSGSSVAMIPEVYVPAGQKVELYFKADVSSSAAGFTFQPKLTQIWVKTSSGTTEPAVVSGLPVSGQSITYQNPFATPTPTPASSGSLSAKLSVFSPKTNLVAGKTNQRIFEVDITAPAYGNVTISDLILDFAGSMPVGYLSNVKVKNYKTQNFISSGNSSFLGNRMTINLTNPVTIQNAEVLDLEIIGDLASQASGNTLQITLSQIGWKQGVVNSTNLSGVNVVGNTLTLTKVLPVNFFLDTSKPFTTTLYKGQSGVNLFTFALTNTGEQTVGLDWISFSSVNLSSNPFSKLYLTNSSGSTLATGSYTYSSGYSYYDFALQSPIAISPGQTQYITVKADVNPGASGSFGLKQGGESFSTMYAKPSDITGSIDVPNITIN